MTSKVLIIIPALNEATTIEEVILRIHERVPAYDVVVVDDGSTDSTAKKVTDQGIARLLRLPFNLGIGGAMQTGYKYAARHGYDLAIQCDADGQHPVNEIARLAEAVLAGQADVIIGSRYVADSDYRPSFTRRVGKSLLSRWIDILVGGGITDTTSGFRAMNRAAIDVLAQNYPEDYPEPEALVILHRAGLSVAELPVQMLPRQGGTSSIHPHRAVYYMIKVTLAAFIHRFRPYARSQRGDKTAGGSD